MRCEKTHKLLCLPNSILHAVVHRCFNNRPTACHSIVELTPVIPIFPYSVQVINNTGDIWDNMAF